MSASSGAAPAGFASSRRPRLFLSFTKQGRDAPFVRQLLARISEHPIDAWIYEDYADEIPGGQVISDHLRDRIQWCDIFVPIVSPATFRSAYTTLEVAVALARRNAGEDVLVLPLVSTELDLHPSDWPGPYGGLGALRFRTIDFTAPAAIEESVIHLCADVGLEYEPRVPEDPRLPLMDRFVAELRDKCPRIMSHEIGTFRRLMVIFSQFVAAFQQPDYERAAWLIKFFTLSLEYEYPHSTFYYPVIVRGVCEILTGRLDEGERTLATLASHPMKEESWHGAQGWIRLQQGRPQEAIACYEEALRRRPDDPAARAGLLVAQIQCGIAVDFEAAFRGQNPLLILMPEDHCRIDLLKAFALLSSGRLADAERAFQELAESGQIDADGVVEYSRLLAGLGRKREAVQVLDRFAGQFPEHDLLHHQRAVSAAQVGDFAQAGTLLERLAQRRPFVRQYRIDAALIQLRLKNLGQAQRLVTPLVDDPDFPLPQSRDDFYLNGYANWILQRRERAEYDFQRSQFPAGKHYAVLSPMK